MAGALEVRDHLRQLAACWLRLAEYAQDQKRATSTRLEHSGPPHSWDLISKHQILGKAMDTTEAAHTTIQRLAFENQELRIKVQRLTTALELIAERDSHPPDDATSIARRALVAPVIDHDGSF
jgi:hypothetical protein